MKKVYPGILARPYLLLLSVILSYLPIQFVSAQKTVLRPGFDKEEYRELLLVHVLIYDSTKRDTTKKPLPKPQQYTLAYRSPVLGLDNRWDLWKSKKEPVAVVNLRGTTLNNVSWLENFYAAMIPASGELKLSDSNTFKYHLADHPRAGVHVGWMLGVAFLAQDIVPKIDSCYKSGIKDFILTGHSQGGGLTLLLTAYLYDLQKQKQLPQDIRFKTYASAGPKVGNTYFAYQYESTIAGGWGYNVVNAADWVPETPFTVQTLDDFNETNPFKGIDGIIKKQKLLARIALKHAYKKMKKPSEKAMRNYKKYLGGFASKAVVKNIPQFQPPVYANSANFVRIGPTVTLVGDEAYFKKYPDSDKEIFVHHLPEAYLYLLEKYNH